MHTHTLDINLSKVKQGENSYTCTSCNQVVILVWNGVMQGDVFQPTNWGPRHEDAEDMSIVEAQITYA